MNIAGIVDPEHKDREIVDLLYFPTGGGKTEAYLGIMAFVIANRRLRATDDGKYNLDGGVTIMLRYTLRLLTTQQRDRITKMVIAAEMIRRQAYPQFGKEPISIGFWVGGGVTPNKFDEFIDKSSAPQTEVQGPIYINNFLLVPSVGRNWKKIILILTQRKNLLRFSALIEIASSTNIRKIECPFLYISLMKRYMLNVQQLSCQLLINLQDYLGM